MKRETREIFEDFEPRTLIFARRTEEGRGCLFFYERGERKNSFEREKVLALFQELIFDFILTCLCICAQFSPLNSVPLHCAQSPFSRRSTLGYVR